MSVRGERVVYKERDVEYDEAPRRHYTTIKRYQIPESTRSVYSREDEVKEDKIVIRRERPESSPRADDVQWKVTERVRETPREEVDYRMTERIREREAPREEVDYRFSERIRERSPTRRDVTYRVVERERDSDWDRNSHLTHSAGRSDYRVIERDREIIRAPSPPEPERVREYRFERERDISPPRRHSSTLERPYELEKYSKSTEYFAQPAPQPIIIREPAPQPIIIREREPPIIIREREERREPQYEFIEREEVKEDKSLVKREEPPPPAPVPVPEPEQKPEEESYFYERRVREIDRSKRREDSFDRKTEIRPRDSASQYSSDDSYEYVRRERIYDDRSRSHSPNHRRHLAEGAIAGVGAAEILRHHRRAEGKPVGGRLRDGVAGAAVGALGAEALSRVRSARSKSRSRRISRSRSRSSSYDRYDDRRGHGRKRRSRSRSKSLSRAQQLGGLAAVAAVGALAGYALNKRSNKETVIVNNDGPPRRSRSRRRGASVDTYYTDERLSHGGGKALNPEHRNLRIAQAGLASAAAAGIWDRVRSKSRGRRSKSRVKQGVPIAAAGLGGAALAGLYENSKANKERKQQQIIEDERNRGRRRRSRTYGNEPIYPETGRGYYSDEEPGMYRRRHRGGSSDGSSPDTRRRSRSRTGRHLAEAGAAAGVAAVAAHEIGKRRERSRQREAERRRHEDDAGYGDQYAHDHGDGYNQQQAYPSSNYFPPPPTGEYAQQQPYPEQNPYPPYNPSDYAQQPASQQPYPETYVPYADESGAPAPHANTPHAGGARYGEPGPAHEGPRGENPENVSAPTTAEAPVAEHESQNADGVDTPRPRSRSQSRVRFDLDQNVEHSPESRRGKGKERAVEEQHGGDDNGNERGPRHHRREDEHSSNDRGRRRPSSQLMNDKYEREPNDSDSEGTVELPARFDERGNRMPEGDNPLVQAINGLLGSSALADLLGGLSHHDDDGRSGRRRHRH
ncbi:hypothetical protein M433DRAFT_21887 [Acidomyces richmondensis BFW]|nr:hypothetical protein M433DRAFT_21887 [Acidomyces richmondensis BFW]